MKKRLARRVVSRLGVSVWVNGIELQAVIEDEEVDEETGYMRAMTASFEKEHEPFILKYDSMLIGDEEFKINRKQQQNSIDNLFTVELKRRPKHAT